MITKCAIFTQYQTDLSTVVAFLAKEIDVFLQNPGFKREIVHVSEFVIDTNHQSGYKKVSVIIIYKEILAGEQWTKD